MVEDPSKIKAATRVSAATITVEKKFEHLSCILCKSKHALWECSLFQEKTPTQRAKLSADNKLCFFCLQGNQAFRQCPRAENCIKPGCTSTQKVVLYGNSLFVLLPFFQHFFAVSADNERMLIQSVGVLQ